MPEAVIGTRCVHFAADRRAGWTCGATAVAMLVVDTGPVGILLNDNTLCMQMLCLKLPLKVWDLRSCGCA
jgi:3-hydroxy-3-methylglutaryl CoA synthase